MKIIKFNFLLGLIVVIFSSCEKVIDVDLNSAEPRYVIEGVVTNGVGYHSVKISKTKNFDEDNNFEYMANAIVTLSDDKGNAVTLEPNDKGVFINLGLEGVPGRIYHLKVEIEGKTFTSVSTMPYPVQMDSLYLQKDKNFGQELDLATVRFHDPAGIDNYYRYILYVNDRRINSLFINRDRRRDGQEINRSFPYHDLENPLIAGDTVSVLMECIEKPIFDYFLSLNQTINQDVASPANPISNISGGALGYFSAHTAQIESVVVETRPDRF